MLGCGQSESVSDGLEKTVTTQRGIIEEQAAELAQYQEECARLKQRVARLSASVKLSGVYDFPEVLDNLQSRESILGFIERGADNDEKQLLASYVFSQLESIPNGLLEEFPYREHMVSGLAFSDDPRIGPLLLKMVRETNQLIAKERTRAISEGKLPKEVEIELAFKLRLEHDKEDVRSSALRVLFIKNCSEFMQALKLELNSQDYKNRALAVELLGASNEKEATELLTELRGDHDNRIVSLALAAQVVLNWPTVDPNVIKDINALPADLRELVAGYLSEHEIPIDDLIDDLEETKLSLREDFLIGHWTITRFIPSESNVPLKEGAGITFDRFGICHVKVPTIYDKSMARGLIGLHKIMSVEKSGLNVESTKGYYKIEGREVIIKNYKKEEVFRLTWYKNFLLGSDPKSLFRNDLVLYRK